MGASLLSIDGWYPTLRGGPSPRAALNLEDDRSASELEALWPTLGPGERVVLRVPPSARARGRLSRLEALLEPSDQGESFVEFGGGGDVVALLPTARGASFRSSLDLLPSDLPGGRALSAFLRLASPFSLAQRFGRPEVVVWTRLGHALPDRDLPALPVDGDLAVRVHVRDRARPVEVRALDRRGAPAPGSRSASPRSPTTPSGGSPRRSATSPPTSGSVAATSSPTGCATATPGSPSSTSPGWGRTGP